MSTLSVTTYERGFRGLWTGLVVNLLLAVACSPLLLALVLVEDPLASLPFFAVLSCVCGPALMGAFGAFAADDRPARCVRGRVPAWLPARARCSGRAGPRCSRCSP